MRYELNGRLRRDIEWHFKNYGADIALRRAREADIIESGLTANISHIGSSNRISDPTADKAAKLIDAELDKIFNTASVGDWAAVIRNTFTAFRWEPEFGLMVSLYIEGKNYKQLFGDGFPERVFWRWRDKWLTSALKWAKSYDLL